MTMSTLQILADTVLAYEPPVTDVRLHPELLGRFRKADDHDSYILRSAPTEFSFCCIPIEVDTQIGNDVMILLRHGREAGRITLTGGP